MAQNARAASKAWTLEPLTLAEHSYFWVGVRRETRPDGTSVNTGEHMYVEYFVPAELRHEYPLVFIHGGGGQGVAFLGRGSGHPGWAHHALAAGYAVYVLDRPGYGRNPPHPKFVGPVEEPTPYEAVTPFFEFGARSGRWPGSGGADDPGVGEFMAQQRPMRFDTAAAAHSVWKELSVELVERIGPAVVLMHSAGGPFGWISADASPELVKAVVAVEPLGPSTVAIPLAFDPPVSSLEELALEPLPPPEVEMGPLAGLPRVVQADPPRRLANLAQVPILMVGSDDPRWGQLNSDSIAFLRQGGCTVEEMRLADHGIRGNGHFMSLEDNNGEVLAAVLEQLDRLL